MPGTAGRANEDQLREFMDAVREGELVYEALGLANSTPGPSDAPNAPSCKAPRTISEFVVMREAEMKRLGLDAPMMPAPRKSERASCRGPDGRRGMSCEWQSANSAWADAFGMH
jgi:hypothetical protein